MNTHAPSFATPEETVRACFHAYESKDREALERIIAPEFTFTSPLDDAISRETYFARCWPNSEHIDKFDWEHVVTHGEDVFVEYRLHPAGRRPFRNMEHFTVKHGQITSVRVYFGAESDNKDESGNADGGSGGAEAEIRRLVEDWAEGLRKKDADRVLAHFAGESTRFYLAPPLVADEPMRKNLTEWLAGFRGELRYEIRDLEITAGEDTAFAHSLNHMGGTKAEDGEEVDLWFRETMGFRKIGGQWKITHEHESVPFLMDGSGKAALELTPESA